MCSPSAVAHRHLPTTAVFERATTPSGGVGGYAGRVHADRAREREVEEARRERLLAALKSNREKRDIAQDKHGQHDDELH